jgi:hypothetical protein
MGIYLAKPSTEISCEGGDGAGVEFVVGEMQVRHYATFFACSLC